MPTDMITSAQESCCSSLSADAYAPIPKSPRDHASTDVPLVHTDWAVRFDDYQSRICLTLMLGSWGTTVYLVCWSLPTLVSDPLSTRPFQGLTMDLTVYGQELHSVHSCGSTKD